MPDLSRTGIVVPPAARPGLFQSLLGASYTRLHALIRDVHGGRSLRLQGIATVTRGGSLLARAICHLAALPEPQVDGPVRVELLAGADEEIWTRWFSDSMPMRSQLRAVDGLLVERLGPLRLRFRLVESGGAVEWFLQSVSFLGIPAPARWLRHTTARCTGLDGRYCFEVTAALPFVGEIVSYRGCVNATGIDAT